MKWQYKGEWYESIKVDWEEYSTDPKAYRKIHSDMVLYIPKWDKCYTIERFGTFGNGNQLKFMLKDIYQEKYLYCMAKYVELVIKCEDGSRKD